MKKIAFKIFGPRIKAATCKPTSVKKNILKTEKFYPYFMGKGLVVTC